MSNPPIKYCEDCRFYKPSGSSVPDTDAICTYPKNPSGRALVARHIAQVPRRCSEERIWTPIYDACGPEASRFEPKLTVVAPDSPKGGDIA